MNNLKLDFEENQKVRVVVIDKSINRTVFMNKKELLQHVIENSKEWEDRETVLIGIIQMSWFQLKDFCKSRKLSFMKENPRWTRQNSVLTNSQISDMVDYTQRQILRM
jgi:hypothetical protein